MATWNPFWMFGRMGGADGHWAGWVHAVDAEQGLILVRGAVPGPKGGLLVLRSAAKKNQEV